MTTASSTPACPICAAAGCRALGSRDSYTLFACPGCQAQFWSPFRNPGRAWYEQQAQYRSDPPRLYRGYHRAFLRRLAALPPASRILDLGCGSGALVVELARRGQEVWGVDTDRLNIEIAQRHAPNAHLFASSLEDFLARADLPRFDVVTCFEVLEHLDDPLGFLRRVAGLLQPQGLLVLSVPSRERFWPNLYAWDFPPFHLSRWNEAALAALFHRAGLAVGRVVYTDQYIHFKELFSGFARRLTEPAKRVRGGYRLVALFTITLPAALLRLVTLLVPNRNGVMVAEATREAAA